jgi:hypothetical protein
LRSRLLGCCSFCTLLPNQQTNKLKRDETIDLAASP